MSTIRPLRAGIVGGGRGAPIGAVHRMAAELDGQARVIAGALSSDPQLAAESAREWHLPRSYADYRNMAAVEPTLSDGIDFVIVATPNHLHFPVVSAFLEAGIPVVCDKPLAFSVAEAEALASMTSQGRPLLALTHTYAGYPLVRQARDRVCQGALGDLRKVLVEYQQDWLMTPLEREGNRQAQWRTDPARAGISGCVGDIGTHAAHLLEYITGQRIDSVCADLGTVVDGRRLDDDASMLLRLQGGARGTLVCSQVACGEENNLNVRLYGSKAGLEWRQQEPNTLILKPAGEPWQHLRAGHGYLSEAARRMGRTPAGHPEGYIEALANLYRAFISDVHRVAAGERPLRDYPGVEEGVRGLRFIEAAVRSSAQGGVWERV